MTVDRILDVIDAGLQTPVPDPTFGEVSPPNREGCTRCGAKVEDGDFCGPCRAFLLGDCDQDPSDWRDDTRPFHPRPEQVYESALAEARYIRDGLRYISPETRNGDIITVNGVGYRVQDSEFREGGMRYVLNRWTGSS